MDYADAMGGRPDGAPVLLVAGRSEPVQEGPLKTAGGDDGVNRGKKSSILGSPIFGAVVPKSRGHGTKRRDFAILQVSHEMIESAVRHADAGRARRATHGIRDDDHHRRVPEEGG